MLDALRVKQFVGILLLIFFRGVVFQCHLSALSSALCSLASSSKSPWHCSSVLLGWPPVRSPASRGRWPLLQGSQALGGEGPILFVSLV